MSKHMRLVLCLAFRVCGALHAAEASKGMSWSGNVGTGYHHSWKSGVSPTASGFLVDQLKMRMDGTISNTTKVVLQKGIFLHSNTGGSPDFADSVNYTSQAQYRLSTAATLAFEAAYIDHKCGEGMHTWIGLFGTPFGIESMFDRYDRGAYYYSGFMTGMYYGMGIAYDLGVKIALTDILPGSLEIAVLDGRTYSGGGDTHLSPAVALRWSMESKSGDMSITPVVSAYLGRFHGFAKQMMLGGGIIGKFGALSANAEVLWGSNQQVAGDTSANNKDSKLAVYVEPAFDLGMAAISAKAEFVSDSPAGGGASQSDFNVGAAISKSYEGNFNVKLAYQHIGLSGNLGNGAAVAAGTTHANDFRVLVSTKW